MTDETWIPCPGYEGLYEVSDLGRARSVDRVVFDQATGRPRRRRGQMMTLDPSGGYISFAASRNGKRLNVRVHIAVCTAFHGVKPTPAHEARHLNGNSADNRPENLVWGTHSENMLDKVRHGTHHEAKKTRCKRGHKYTPENTRIQPARSANTSPRRSCKTCASIRAAEQWKARGLREAS